MGLGKGRGGRRQGKNQREGGMRRRKRRRRRKWKETKGGEKSGKVFKTNTRNFVLLERIGIKKSVDL